MHPFRLTLANGWTIVSYGRTVAAAVRSARAKGWNVPVRHV